MKEKLNELLQTNNKSSIIGAINENKHDITKHLDDNVELGDGVHGLKIEKGVFTPVLFGDTNHGQHTYGTQRGSYYRINNLVYAEFAIRLIKKDVNMAGQVYLSGLPFVAANGYFGSVTISYIDGFTLDGQLGMTVIGNNIDFRENLREGIAADKFNDYFSVYANVTYLT